MSDLKSEPLTEAEIEEFLAEKLVDLRWRPSQRVFAEDFSLRWIVRQRVLALF